MTTTDKFKRSLRELFFVPRPQPVIRDIRQQFVEGYARSISQDVYEVDIHDIPARVVMTNRCLKAVWYVPREV